MAKYCGKDFLIQRETATPGQYATIGFLRSTSMSINNETVDVTTKDDMPWRQLLAECGVRSMSLSGAGVFSDNATVNSVITDVMAGTIGNYQIISGHGDKFTGLFQPVSFERSGEYNDSEQYSITLESGGEITFTAPS
jgi:TP901-1 family phage major tail protein